MDKSSFRMQDPRGLSGPNPTVPNEQAPQYFPDDARFRRTEAVAGELMEQRALEKAKYDAKIDMKRQAEYEREAKRWGSYEASQARDQARAASLQESPASWTNTSGLPFNVLNHKYDEGDRGQSLKDYDQGVRDRASHRADRLSQKAHSTNFDIITGAPRK